MKTTFSRTFFTAAIVLMAALLLVGASFQVLVRNLMTRQVENQLWQYILMLATGLVLVATVLLLTTSLLGWKAELTVAQAIADALAWDEHKAQVLQG